MKKMMTVRIDCEADGCDQSAEIRIEEYQDNGEVATVDVCQSCLMSLCVAEECGDASCSCATLPKKMRGRSCDH